MPSYSSCSSYQSCALGPCRTRLSRCAGATLPPPYSVVQSASGNFQIVGGQPYATLAEAVAAAEAGDTIELLADDSNAEAVTIDKAITLDLGGFTLTSSGAITTTADTTIANGTLATTGAITVNAGAALTLAADAEIDGNIVEVVYVKGTLNVYGTVDSTAYDASYAIVPNADGFVLNCYEGCVVKGKAQAIKINCQGTEQAPIGGTVNISGGYFTSDGNSYAPIKFNKTYNKTVLNLTGGTFDGHKSIIGVVDWDTFWANNEKLTDACKAKFDNINEAESLKDQFKSIAEFVADGYALVKGDDNYYTIQKAYAITIAPVENGTLETSVTNNIAAGTEVTVTATPAENYVLVSITTNDVALADDVTTFVMPAENVTVAATFESAGPTYPPTWPEESTYTEAFGTWAGKYDLTGVDLTTDAAKNAFLMNVDPNGTLPELKIESIAVEGNVATIVVSAAGKDLQTGINGVLYVSGCNALGGEWVTTVVDATADSFTDGKATFTVEGAQFMKAKIGFKAETPAN